ncbi:MAG: D-sedoheptulose-7-phosphate isomerase [Gemmatimonadota bacterium]
MRQNAEKRLRDLASVAEAAAECSADIAHAAAAMRDALAAGRRLFFCGNGGSAADAQHVATEYVVRYARERRALPALALTTDTSLLTAAANDLGFAEVFARQVDALMVRGDVLVIHSTSGRSPNVLRAAVRARALGAAVIGLTASGGGELAPLCDICIRVPTDRTDRAQEIHMCIEHIICEMIEEDM